MDRIATREAYLRSDCRSCVRRLQRDFDLARLSLHFASRDKRYVRSHPEQSRADRGLRLLARIFGPPYPNPNARMAHHLPAVAGFTFVCCLVIPRYLNQREQLDKTVRQQRDQLLPHVLVVKCHPDGN